MKVVNQSRLLAVVCPSHGIVIFTKKVRHER